MVRGQAPLTLIIFSGFLFGLFSGFSLRFIFLQGEETLMNMLAKAICSLAPFSCGAVFSAFSMILFLFGMFEIFGSVSESENPFFSLVFYFIGSVLGLLIGLVF